MLDDKIRKNIEKFSWPFKEAEAILKKINYQLPQKGYVLFETGYGPSGLPHIGTFGEVVRTKMVQHAFEKISNMPTRLFCISDDMDGMRKIPDTIPNKESYHQYLDLPLTSVPDPFGTHQSFGHNMNARFQNFLNHFDFECQLLSATECYKQGVYNDSLMKVLKAYDAIMNIMLPTLGEERQKTYSPFLPICPTTGKVLNVPIVATDTLNGTVSYNDALGNMITVPVTNGHCKLQWKPDFGMRWATFEVDFEMYGKDHLVNGRIYSEICQTIGTPPPHQMFYELFLDQNGQKISKSKGNGLSLEQWLQYAPRESLSFFMYQSPQKAKKLFIDIIPKNVDEYLTWLDKYSQELDEEKKLTNPAYHVHMGTPPLPSCTLSYSLLLNLVAACGTSSEDTIWGYIKMCNFNVVKDTNSQLGMLIKYAIQYYHDFVKPHQIFKKPNHQELEALKYLRDALKTTTTNNPQELQNLLYDVAVKFQFEIKDWFKGLYEILLGSSSGPRFGSFISLYGVQQTIELIDSKIDIKL